MTLEDLLFDTDIFCFDVDSTVLTSESIDDFAEFLGKGAEVSAVTKKAMEGSMKFEDALDQRLKAMAPTFFNMTEFLKTDSFHFTPHFVDLIKQIQRLGREINFVSGGFDAIIKPKVAVPLGVPTGNVFANDILFDSDGRYAGADTTKYTCRDMGKQAAVRAIIDRFQTRTGKTPKVLMVGDGATDLQAKPPANWVLGYGGIARRALVEENADVFILSFEDAVNALKQI